MEQRKTSSRPFTVGSFGRKLELFDRFIEEFTHVDEELNPEERRLELQERLTNGNPPRVWEGGHLSLTSGCTTLIYPLLKPGSR